MKTINAKYNSVCAETSCKIKKGERMVYDYSTRKCYAIGSSKAIAFINDKDDAGDMIEAEQEAYFDNFCQNNNI